MIPNAAKRGGVTMNVQAITGWDSVAWFFLTRPAFARYVARKMKKAGRHVDQYVFPDGSSWTHEGKQIIEGKD